MDVLTLVEEYKRFSPNLLYVDDDLLIAESMTQFISFLCEIAYNDPNDNQIRAEHEYNMRKLLQAFYPNRDKYDIGIKALSLRVNHKFNIIPDEDFIRLVSKRNVQ